MGKVQAWIVKQALHKGENISEKYSWTIHFLVDLKIVYILTYAYITIVNLISSTANIEATSDTESMVLFNVTLSPEHRNVEVASISDAILWNCRNQSVTSYYYRSIYVLLIIIMSAALGGYLVTKFMAMVTVSCLCKKDSCTCAVNKHGLTKLWYIAILEQIKNRRLVESQSQQQQPATATEKTSVQSEEINKSSHNRDNDQHRNDGAQVVVADVHVEDTDARHNPSDTSHLHQGITPVTEAQGKSDDMKAASHDMKLTSHDDRAGERTAPNNQDIELGQIDDAASNKLKPLKFELKDYQSLLSEEVTSNILKGLGYRSRCTNFCRQSIPHILLFLSTVILGLSYLSYDLHPLACVVRPADKFISYNATTKRVEIEFSSHLRDFQKAAGGTVLGLVLLFLILAYCFYYLSEKVIKDIKSKAKDRIDTKTKELESLHHT